MPRLSQRAERTSARRHNDVTVTARLLVTFRVERCEKARYNDGMARSRRGRFLGVPYDFRRPTRRRIRVRLWNPSNPRLFVPKVFGWGYDVNLAAPLAWWRRLRR
jgi:hypothetical protein